MRCSITRMTGVTHQHATARAAQDESRAKARRTCAYYDDIKRGVAHLNVSFENVRGIEGLRKYNSKGRRKLIAAAGPYRIEFKFTDRRPGA
jgi:hypothetical protein